MKLIIINNSSDTRSYVSGAVIAPASGTLDVSSDNWFSLYSDNTFLADVRLNNIIINDGIKSMVMPESETYLQYLNTTFNYNNKDIDGATIVRTKAAKKGWSFWALPIEIITSTLNGTVYAKNSEDVDIPGITCKIYDLDNVEITDPDNLTDCVKTIVDVENAFDVELIGGALRIHSNPAEDVRLWIVGAPDIPAGFGGSKEFASGINLKFLAPDSSFEIDGRVSKYIAYNAANHQGKIRIILKHPTGLMVNMQIVLHTYRL